jgi:hypothetical protein
VSLINAPRAMVVNDKIDAATADDTTERRAA